MAILHLIDGMYCKKSGTRPLLEQISAQFEAGKTYLLLGESDLERDILTKIMAGLDFFTSGEVIYSNSELSERMNKRLLTREASVVFQQFNYIPTLSAWENLYFYLRIVKQPQKKQECIRYLNSFGINNNLLTTPLQQSDTFTQKKYSLAKAMITKPSLVILDSLLSDLSLHRQEQLMSYLSQSTEGEDTCIVILESSQFLGQYADEVWGLNRGRLAFIKSK